MRVYELMPTDGRKSFYGKAKVIVNSNTETLKSYETLIAEKNTDTGEIKRLWGRMVSNNRQAHKSVLRDE